MRVATEEGFYFLRRSRVVVRSLPQSLLKELNDQALDSRKWIVRAAHDPGTHLGGSLSAIDILTALYHHFLRVDPKRPDWSDRDRIILSKGHVAYALYIVLAKRGFITVEDLKLYDRPGNFLGTHPSTMDRIGAAVAYERQTGARAPAR